MEPDQNSAPTMSSINLLKSAPVSAVGAACETGKSDIDHVFSDSIVEILLSTGALERLSGIGFFGAVDYIYPKIGTSGHNDRHNRLEHSIGVARLADIYAREAGIPDNQRQLLLSAALLHDIGHGPLSHTLEPVFEAEFGINHHIMTRRLVTGEVPLGKEIPEILADACVDLDEVLALIEGEHDGDVGFLFSGQINLDTLEGINRCHAFITQGSVYEGCESMVRHWAQGQVSTVESNFDDFWHLKHQVYNLFIGGNSGACLDAVAQAYMRSNLTEFSGRDFLDTDDVFRHRHPALFTCLDSISGNEQNSEFKIPKDWLLQDVSVKKRDFYIERESTLEDLQSLNHRYKQTRTVIVKRLAELLAEREEMAVVRKSGNTTEVDAIGVDATGVDDVRNSVQDRTFGF